MMDNNPKFPVLLIDDEASWLRVMSRTLTRTLGINNILTCQDSREVMALLQQTPVSLIVLDMTMPHLSGDELLEQLQQGYPMVPVIVMTGLNQVELAVKCMKLGAFDYFIKTTEEERILSGVRRALTVSELQAENRELRERFLQGKIEHPEFFAEITSQSKQMRKIFQYIEAIAVSSEPVLITGESGVGKELIARSVHRATCQDGPWVAVNVAGLDDNVFSDTLFGHARGAFTGADQARSGVIEQAAGGVLFLDEIGDLEPGSQIKLLRLLQEGEYYPLGKDRPSRVNARIVFATNQDLAARQQDGSFRTDLYYRLCSHRIDVPPLRERREDIPLLLEKFLDAAAKDMGKQTPRAPAALITLLQAYSFPGNVRELRAMTHEAVSLYRKGQLSLEPFRKTIATGDGFLHLKDEEPGVEKVNNSDTIQFPAKLPTLKVVANLLVDEAMLRAGGNQTQAASLLGISRPALSKRLKLRD
ncbi:MAG TPA: sigma-54 dependent transcriptional regulator [Geopsychrobacteraceae bacterium]|nr:sigma-54 dependent transcriptional regulator [Geopsychrobacteraceae bacterium]